MKETHCGIRWGLSVWENTLSSPGSTRSFERLLLSDVPKSIRRLFHGFRTLSRSSSALVEVARHICKFKSCRKGVLQRLWDPLSYRQVNGPNISLTINSLDDPESVRPEFRFSAQLEVSWCSALATLPTKEMDLTGSPGFVNHQWGGN